MAIMIHGALDTGKDVIESYTIVSVKAAIIRIILYESFLLKLRYAPAPMCQYHPPMY